MADDADGGLIPWKLILNGVKATYKIPLAKAFGARVVIIGPKASGKSNVYNFIDKGRLKPEAAHDSTQVAQTSGWMPKFVGTADDYLQVASYVDTTGQKADTAGADAIGIVNPDVVIVVLDGTKDVSENENFVLAIMAELLKADPAVRNAIKQVALFFNKFDKSKKPNEFIANVERIQNIARENGGEAFGNRVVALHTVFVSGTAFGNSLAKQAFITINDRLCS